MHIAVVAQPAIREEGNLLLSPPGLRGTKLFYYNYTIIIRSSRGRDVGEDGEKSRKII
jgi:hypothetical protein